MKTAIFYVMALGLITFSVPVDAQKPGASPQRPNENQINLQVWTGRATAIDFSSVKEQITQIFLADPSRFTYATDTPLETGRATTIFIRRIQPLKFPNLTTASVTNLFVKTKTADGNARLYTFNVQAGENSPKYSTLDIYSADFVLVHTSGLSIDIEIDEPYVGNTKAPHHCTDQRKDDIRNAFFTNNNWVVVRFSEKQAVKYPLSCCRVIV